MADVIVAGELLAEFMAEKIGQRFDTPGVFLGPYPSGAPGIFIDQIAKLGVSCSMLACVGNDGFGDQLVTRLKKDGVDVSHIRRHASLPTGTAFITYQKGGGREYIFNIGDSAAGTINSSMVTARWVKGAKYLNVMGSFLADEKSRQIVFKAIDLAVAGGAKIVFDPNVRLELLQERGLTKSLYRILAQCAIFLPSQMDIEVLFGKGQEAQIAGRLLKKYPRMEMIVVKKSSKGATYYDREGVLIGKPFKVKQVDPTGAGDIFGATFLASLIKKFPKEAALELACAAGALSVTKRGPMEGTVSFPEITKFIATV